MLVENDAYLLQLSYYIHRNPLRAGMVKRLASYKWSSYQAYAYGKNTPEWLNTDMILSQFINVKDRHRAYRENAQRYSKEEQRLWEDLRHGIFLGKQMFTEKIRKRYLPDAPHAEMPLQKQLSKNVDADALFIKAATLLNCDPRLYRKSVRISNADKLDRDLLIYLLWHAGHLTNRQIGERFGLSYSAVSRRVGIIKDLLENDKALYDKYRQIKSQI
jgi:hypothetical protein